MIAARSKAIPLWFFAAFVPMTAAQIARLYQTTALGWIVCDYTGRIGALLTLALIPVARATAFRREPLRTSWPETSLWILGLVVLFPLIGPWINHVVTLWIPNTRLGRYIAPAGWLSILDLTAGMALTAYHEEIVFRRCARAVFNPRWGDGVAMIVITSVLFAAFHWTTGIGNISAVFFFGIYAMCFLRRVGSLWPLIVAHFLIDFIQFGGLHLLF